MQSLPVQKVEKEEPPSADRRETISDKPTSDQKQEHDEQQSTKIFIQRTPGVGYNAAAKAASYRVIPKEDNSLSGSGTALLTNSGKYGHNNAVNAKPTAILDSPKAVTPTVINNKPAPLNLGNTPHSPPVQKTAPLSPKPIPPTTTPVIAKPSTSIFAKDAPKTQVPAKTREQATNETQALLLELIESIDSNPLDPKTFPPFNAEDWKEKEPEPIPEKKKEKPIISKSKEPDVANPFGYVPYIPEITYVPKPKPKDEASGFMEDLDNLMLNIAQASLELDSL